MRDAFFAKLEEKFKTDDRLMFLTADLGYKLFDPLIAIDPSRVINVGIREAGMVGFAAGLAKKGFMPFVYSIVPFATIRCLEQIKIDLCYNQNKAVVVGVGGGFVYGPNGPTHYGVDDIALMSTLPGMGVYTPCDPLDVGSCVESAIDNPYACYIRLGRNKEPQLLDAGVAQSAPESLRVVQRGKGLCIVTNGFILDQVVALKEWFAEQGLEPTIIQISIMRPFPDQDILAELQQHQAVLTVEEHLWQGGLGSQLTRLVAQNNLSVKIENACIPDQFISTCQSRLGALKWAQIDSSSLQRRIERLV